MMPLLVRLDARYMVRALIPDLVYARLLAIHGHDAAAQVQ